MLKGFGFVVDIGVVYGILKCLYMLLLELVVVVGLVKS